jgi:predicted enzyme related to lactoylglutathione lyase
MSCAGRRRKKTEKENAMETRIGSVPVFVSDQQRALDFYTDKLGYEVALDMPIGNGVRWLTVRPTPGETEFILFHPALAGPNGQGEEMRKRVGTWTGIVLLTDDCCASYRDLVERGVEFMSEPKQPFWGGWIVEFLDPDGNRFQLVERPAHMR